MAVRGLGCRLKKKNKESKIGEANQHEEMRF